MFSSITLRTFVIRFVMCLVFTKGEHAEDFIDGLQCYNCNSTATDEDPYCFSKNLEKLNTQQLDNVITLCTRTTSVFCYVKVTEGQKNRPAISERGCATKYDRKGNKLSKGCFKLPNVQVCLCDQDYCNNFALL